MDIKIPINFWNMKSDELEYIKNLCEFIQIFRSCGSCHSKAEENKRYNELKKLLDK